MSQPRRKMSKFTSPDRFMHYNMGGKIIKAASKREQDISLAAMERRQKVMDARREDDGDILYA